MTRFHSVVLVVAVLAGIAFVRHEDILLGVAILGLLVVMGLGVAIPQLRLFGNYICRGSTVGKRVALTFDDGPDPRSTPQLLAWLRAEKIHATFFCIGQKIEAHPGLAAEIVRDGHLLQNHSYAHSNFTNFYGKSRLQRELGLAQATIQKITGTAPVYFRPPVGLSNPNTFRAAKKLNLQVIGWTIRSLDTVMTDPQKIAARITRGLRPGAIILLHDGNISAEKLLATVKSSLDSLRRLGYEIVRLDELLK